MKEKVQKFVFMSAVITAILMLMISISAITGVVNITNGCLLRYTSGTNYTDALSHSTTLQATGNYNVIISEVDGQTVNTPDPTTYGQWVDTRIDVQEGTDITLVVSSGSVSLCQAFLPAYNPEQNTAPGTISPYKAGGDINPVTKAPIPIPRIGDTNFLSITLDAKNGNWLNVAKIDKYDQVAVSLQPSKKAQYSNGILTSGVTNLQYISAIRAPLLTDNNIDCSDGLSSYHPLCGIYSIYPIGQTYGTGCVAGCYHTDTNCCCGDGMGGCGDRKTSCCNRTNYWQGDTTTYHPKKVPTYSSSGSSANIIPYSTNKENLINYDAYPLCNISNSYDGGNYCNNNSPPESRRPVSNNGNFCYDYCLANPSDPNCTSSTGNNCQKELSFAYPITPTSKGFWFRADDGTGLLYRFNNSLIPTSQSSLGTKATGTCAPDINGYCFAPQPSTSSNYNILSFASESTNSQYLQFRLLDEDGAYAYNTGGYVINIQQTKCQRTAGSYATDSYPNRGQIQYVIVPSDGTDPTNSDGGGTIGTGLTFDAANKAVVTPNSTGTLWMLITNNFDDYKYSVGQYNVAVETKIATSQFGNDVLAPVLALVRSKVDSAGKLVFKNMTCYQSSSAPCTNFFNYIHGILTIYVMLYGIMYLAGMTQITTEDLVIRIAKIALVAGLMNGGTYNFFNHYVFDFVIGFSDEIISNIAGYNLYANGGAVNPLMFSEGLMTKILFSKTTFAQMLALFSFGISGIFFFFMIFMGVIMILTAILRSFTVYIMAFVAIAFLLSLAPLFLTFMLFEQTYHLFEGWTKAIFRFMIEPIILFAGIIILTQLAEIYIDNILGWSVCWKCTLSFSLPFPSFPLAPSFLTQPLFCINWFAPWGYDYRSGLMGIGLQDMTGFAMIAFCAYGYGDFAEKITQRITGGTGPTASSAASNFTHKVTGYDPKTGDNKFERGLKDSIGKARGEVGDTISKLYTKEGRDAAKTGAKEGVAEVMSRSKEMGGAASKKLEGAASKIQDLIKRGK
jgi:type IV secretion system protein VirB6